METEERSDKKKYGKTGCIIALVLLVLIIIAAVTGLINIPDF